MGLRAGGVAGDFDGLFLVFCREMDDEIQATLPEEVGIPLERAPGRIGIQGKKEEGTERSRAEGSPLHFLFLTWMWAERRAPFCVQEGLGTHS